MDDHRSDLTIPDLLSIRADTYPDRIAFLVDGAHALTFAEWEQRSNSVARGLLDRQVRPGDRIGLYFREQDWIDFAVACCAVQKAGGVAVPLSGQLAPAQVRERLAHCSAVGVLNGHDLAPLPAVQAWTSSVVDLDRGDRTPVGVPVRAADLADIIYTSGTTGKPKGVSATHANLTFGELPPEPRDGPPRYMLSAFPIGSNAGQMTLYAALTRSPVRAVVSRFDSERFCALVDELGVSVVALVPAMAIDMVSRRVQDRHDLSSVERVGSSSAPLPPATARALTEVFPNATVMNAYLSTESSPARTYMVFDPSRPASVGRPDGQLGTELMVADAAGTPLPPGETGEICLRCGGEQRAYYLDPAGTARTFAGGWVRMGDHGYLDGDGYLYIVDRDKDVVKVGGAAVSTLQVEAALYEHPAVVEAAVVGIPHHVMGRMVAAAVVLRAHGSLPELRGFLRERLAAYEVPTRYLLVDALPRNALGKPVKDRVRELFATATATSAGLAGLAAVPPGTLTERRLAQVWSEVMGVAVEGVDDDFFALGGDSLSVARLVAAVEEVFGVELPISVAFDRPVLALQAEWIDTRLAGSAVARETTPSDLTAGPADSGGGGAGPFRVPLSPFQETAFQHWFRQEPPVQVAPMASALRLRTELDLDVLRRALDQLVGRHESLRTVFPDAGDTRSAVVLPDLAPGLVCVDAAGGSAEERERHQRELVARFVGEPFDLEHGPLLRVLVVRMGVGEDVLALSTHHLVSDERSDQVVRGELAASYSALLRGADAALPPAPRWSEFTGWVGRQYPTTREFWRRELDGVAAGVGPLPGQHVDAREFTHRVHRFPVTSTVVGQVRDSCARHGVTLPMCVIAVWAGVLAQWTAAPEVVLVTPISGRAQGRFGALVGSVLQTPFLRVPTAGRPPFHDLLARVRRSVVAATEHQFYPQHEFVGQVPYAARISFDDVLRPVALSGSETAPQPIVPPTPPDRSVGREEAELSVPGLLVALAPDGSLTCTLSYNGNALDQPTVARLGEDVVRYVEHAVAHPDLPLPAPGT